MQLYDPEHELYQHFFNDKFCLTKQVITINSRKCEAKTEPIKYFKKQNKQLYDPEHELYQHFLMLNSA